MNGSTSTAASAAASRLGDLVATLQLNEPDWAKVESTAAQLADGLRAHNVELQTALGQTLLPQNLNLLLKAATKNSPIPGAADQKQAVFQLLRAEANLCRDHNENRSILLEAGQPQNIISLLEAYAELVNPVNTEPLPLSIPDLKIVKTAVGVLLNISLHYDPVRTRLISLEAAVTILKLSLAIYPPGAWSRQTNSTNGSSTAVQNDSQQAENWTLRTELSDWSWRTIDVLRGQPEDSNHNQIFTPAALPYLTRALQPTIPPYPSPSLPPYLVSILVQADIEAFQESCGLLESLVMDVEDFRLALARKSGYADDHGGARCLGELLAFIDRGDCPPSWVDPTGEHRKTFNNGRSAIIKVVAEVVGEDKNMAVLWDDSDPQKPGGAFVEQMVSWIRSRGDLQGSRREDTLACATVCLGNVIRKDEYSRAIAHPPISLVPDLAELLTPTMGRSVTHSLVGLLKHIAQVPENRPILGQAGILRRLSLACVWSADLDGVEITQVTAIGVAKHMCTANAANSIELVLTHPDQPTQPSAFSQILALVRRSKRVAPKSEGTRVFVNAIKSLCSNEAKASTDPTWTARRQAAIKAFVTAEVAAVLAQLIGRSRKYPTLVNEGVVALTLLSIQNGATLVIDALMNPLPSEAGVSGSGSQPLSAVPAIDSPGLGAPRRALDMLIALLRNSDKRTVPEARANIATLVGVLGKKGFVADTRSREVQILKEEFEPVLEEVAIKEHGDGPTPAPLAAAAKQTLETWGL